MKNNVIRKLGLMLAVIMIADVLLSLVGCGDESRTEEYVSHDTSTVSTIDSTAYSEPKRIIGIIVNKDVSSESEIKELCNSIGIDLSDYDNWVVQTVEEFPDNENADSAYKTAKELIEKNSCTDLILAAKGYSDAKDLIKKAYPDIYVYVLEEEDKQTVIVSTKEYTILNGKGFSGNVAWTRVQSKETGEKTVGLINKKGELLYLLDHSELIERMGWSTGDKTEYIITTPFINGLSAVYGYTGGNAQQSAPGFVIINQNGEEVFTCFEEDTYMCGQTDDGVFIILKYDAGGFDTTAAYYFYTIDSDLVLKETGIKHDSDYRSPTYQGYKYITLSDRVYYFSEGHLLNLNNSSWFKIYGARYLGCSNDMVFLDRSGTIWAFPKDVFITITNENELIEALKDKGFTAPPNNSPDVAADNYSVSSWRGGCFYHTSPYVKAPIDYVDLNGDVLMTFPSLPQGASYRNVSDFSGGYAAIYLTGADEKSYVTIIDESGNMQYDPIQCTYTTYWYEKEYDAICSYNGYIFAYDANNNQFTIIAPNGELKKIGDDLAGLKDGVFSCNLKDFQISIGGEFLYLKTTKDSPKYISADGKQTIETVYANYNSNGELVYTKLISIYGDLWILA